MLIPPAYAQAAGAPAGDATAFILQFAPLILIFIVFYFLMIRPQQARVKALQTAIGGLKKGDQVTTAGGIIGKVTRVEDTTVEVEIAANVRVRVVRATLTDVAATGGGKPAND